MANSIIMPKTGMAMEEGMIIEWRVREGDTVAKGDVVALIETDKSTMELESDYSGIILAIVHQAGETVPVTRAIAWVGQKGEAIPADDSPAKSASPTASSPPVQTATAKTDTPVQIPAGIPIGGRFRATPAARTLAKEQGINLKTVVPGGKYGEIRRADVQSAAGNIPVPLPQKFPVPITEAGDTRVALTTIQKITGRRMSESRQSIPEVTAHIRADVTRLLKLRQELNSALAASDSSVKITINDFALAATVKALTIFPRLNSVLDGSDLIYRGSINLGMAVATQRGLMVPVIHNAQDYSLVALSSQTAQLAAGAREGTLRSEELFGGTFTVSNVGMYGITAFTPIINPPEAAILGVCAVEDELKLEGEKVVNRKKIGLSLVYDHRIVDGAESSLFLKELKAYLEEPLLILV